MTKRGHAKILDFGLAKVALAAPSAPGVGASALPTAEELLSSPGSAVGTVAYMSPEQVRGRELDGRTDLFSFGVVLYEMATGALPFRGDTTGVIFEAILNRAPVAPVRLNPDLPSRLEEVIGRALEKVRNLRYQHAADIRAELQRLKRDLGAPVGVVEQETESGRLQDAASGTRAVRRSWKVLVAGAAVVVALAVAGAYFYFHHAPKLTEKDTIVLADFANTTGDPVFDDTLKQALSVSLQQSPFLSLLSEERVKETMGLMGRPSGERLSAQWAREVCQRTGSTAVLEGSISSLGSEYVVGLNAVNCHTGDTLAQGQVQAARKEDVLNALGIASTKLRQRLGESLSTVQRYDTPLAAATTSSLEALKAYSLGQIAELARSPVYAMPHYLRAIELDPNFALAYAYLGNMYTAELDEPGLAAEYLRKAYELRNQVSESERFEITSVYYSVVTGELEKSEQTLRSWAQAYPRNNQPHNILGYLYGYQGKYEEEVEEELEALRLAPGDVTAYTNLMEAYTALNRLDEVKSFYRQALERNLEGQFLHDDRYAIAFLEGDTKEMKRQVEAVLGKPGVEDLLHSTESDTRAFYGQLESARAFSEQAVQLALRAELKEAAAGWKMNSALREAEFGNPGRASQEVKAGLAIASARDVRTLAAVTLASSGDLPRARALADALQKQFPANLLLNRYWLPVVRGYLAIRGGRPAQALKSLEDAAPYDLAFPQPQIGQGGLLYPVYVRGQAYLALHQGEEAAAEFQKFLVHPGIVINSPLAALARLWLGRAYAMSGDAVKARAAYQDFLTLWKDADPDIPILKQAKAEYAKLK